MREKDDIVETYEAKLHRVKRMAVITATIHSFGKFLGYCALTWASVVILGGYVPNLNKHDFFAVTVLVLVEAFRVAVSTFFANIVTRNLVYRTNNPTKLRYDDSDRQRIIAIARVAGPAGQAIAFTFTIIISVQRFPHPSGKENSSSFDGLRHSLRIFYSLVVLHGIVSVFGALHSIILVPLCVTSYSLRTYYDRVVWRGMCNGLLQACDFDFLKFAFEVQAHEYRRNMRAPVVRALYEDLLKYLFWHSKGFAVALIALDSSDSFEQEAAANIVGLWTKLDTEGCRIRLQVRLLSKLADMVDNQDTGRAAVVSFEHLARIDPEGVLQVRSQSGNKSMVEILVKRIEEVVSAGKYDKTIVYAKALIPLLQVGHVIGPNSDQTVVFTKAGMPLLTEQDAIDVQRSMESLLEKMGEVFRGECLIRTKAVAGKVIGLLSKDKQPREEEVNMYLIQQNIQLGRQQHILEDEKKYLEELLGRNKRVLDEWFGTQAPFKLELRDGRPPSAPPLSVHKRTYVTTFLVSAIVVVVSYVCSLLVRNRM